MGRGDEGREGEEREREGKGGEGGGGCTSRPLRQLEVVTAFCYLLT